MEAVSKVRLFIFLNVVELLGILGVLALAIAFQFILHELPCPLCLLQRVGFIGIAVGLLLNLRFHCRPAHYSLTLLSALFTAFVALRQIALHIVPGTGAYGYPILGLHLYTWAFIFSMCILIYTTIILGFGVQYESLHLKKPTWKTIKHICFVMVLAIILANGISTFFECGLKQCPENPTTIVEP